MSSYQAVPDVIPEASTHMQAPSAQSAAVTIGAPLPQNGPHRQVGRAVPPHLNTAAAAAGTSATTSPSSSSSAPYKDHHLVPDATSAQSVFVCSVLHGGFDVYVHASWFFLMAICVGSMMNLNGIISGFFYGIIVLGPLLLLPVASHEAARCLAVDSLRHQNGQLSFGSSAESAYTGISQVGRPELSVCSAEDGSNRVILWPLGGLLSCPSTSRDRQALREVAIVTCAGMAAVVCVIVCWAILAWLFGYHEVAILGGLVKIKEYTKFGKLVAIGMNLSKFILLANIIPAYPLDGATLAVVLMRYLDLPEDQIAVYYQTANAVISCTLLSLAMSSSSILWAMVAFLSGMQAVFMSQLRRRDALHEHPLFSGVLVGASVLSHNAGTVGNPQAVIGIQQHQQIMAPAVNISTPIVEDYLMQ